MKNKNDVFYFLDRLIETYGLNKVASVIACTMSGALVGFIIGTNLIPNDSTIIEKENMKNEN